MTDRERGREYASDGRIATVLSFYRLPSTVYRLQFYRLPSTGHRLRFCVGT